jgi:hypothetical protein
LDGWDGLVSSNKGDIIMKNNKTPVCSLKLEDEPIIVSRKVLYDLRAVMCLNG